MIVQQINLYQERFHEKKLWLSALQTLSLTLLCVLVLAGLSVWQQREQQHAEQESRALNEQKQVATQKLESIRRQLEALLADDRIDQQITRITSAIAARQRVIDFVANNPFSAGAGFSGNLASLSRVRVENVWLDEISLSKEGVRLSGSALKAESVPEYFNQFRRQSLFKGKLFEVFEMEREQSRDWKVDFVIASQAGDSHE